MNTFDFEYKQDNKEPIIVEVDYYYEEPNPFSRESDWDYYGGLIVDGIRFYSGTKELFDIDIPHRKLFTNLRNIWKIWKCNILWRQTNHFSRRIMCLML